MEILLQLIYSGVAIGMIYAVIAFGYQLTFQTSDTLNFGQGDALPKVLSGKPFDLCFTIEEQTWEERTSLQLMVKDIK